MAIYRIPDDFPLISLALASPMVRGGDIILVRQGAGPEVVAVPPDKAGVRIVADGYGPLPLPEQEAELQEEDLIEAVTVGTAPEEITDPEVVPAVITLEGTGGFDLPETARTEESHDHGEVLGGDVEAEEDIPAGDTAGESAVTQGPPLITIKRSGVTLCRLGDQLPSAFWLVLYRRR